MDDVFHAALLFGGKIMSAQGDQTRKKIRDAACMLFSQKGFSRVTMKDICDMTGLSRGGLYRHYGSTAEIFRDIFNTANGSQIDLIAQTIEQNGSAAEAMDQLLDLLYAEMIDSETTLSLAIFEYGQTCDSDFITKMHIQSIEKWSKLIEYGIQRGEFAPVDVEQTVDLLLYSYQGVRMCSRILPDTASAADHVVSHLRSLLKPKA